MYRHYSALLGLPAATTELRKDVAAGYSYTNLQLLI